MLPHGLVHVRVATSLRATPKLLARCVAHIFECASVDLVACFAGAAARWVLRRLDHWPPSSLWLPGALNSLASRRLGPTPRPSKRVVAGADGQLSSIRCTPISNYWQPPVRWGEAVARRQLCKQMCFNHGAATAMARFVRDGLRLNNSVLNHLRVEQRSLCEAVKLRNVSLDQLRS
eukprot:336816-Pleurochrysis_carterae.AAC.2